MGTPEKRSPRRMEPPRRNGAPRGERSPREKREPPGERAPGERAPGERSPRRTEPPGDEEPQESGAPRRMEPPGERSPQENGAPGETRSPRRTEPPGSERRTASIGIFDTISQKSYKHYCKQRKKAADANICVVFFISPLTKPPATHQEVSVFVEREEWL